MKQHHRAQQVDRQLLALLKACPEVSFAWLARTIFDVNAIVDNFYIIDESLSARSPYSHSLPWPVALTLGSFSRKHQFGRSRSFDFKPVHHTVRLLRRRLAWAWHFRSGSPTSSPPLVKRDVQPYDGMIPQGLIAFGSHLTKVVTDHVLQANKLIKQGYFRNAQTPKCVKWSFGWLRRCNMTVSVSDKDGTFVLIPKHLLQTMLNKQLKSKSYGTMSKLQQEAEYKVP